MEVLLGLSIDGIALTAPPPDLTSNPWKRVCNEDLGFEPDDRAIQGNRILVSAIRGHIEARGRVGPNRSDPEVVVQQDVRCIIMLMLGTLFADKSGCKVSLTYLPLLRNLATTGKYSWGDAVHAYLYNQLCKTSKHLEGGDFWPLDSSTGTSNITNN